MNISLNGFIIAFISGMICILGTTIIFVMELDVFDVFITSTLMFTGIIFGSFLTSYGLMGISRHKF